MNLIKFIKANDAIVRDIKMTLERMELTREEFNEFQEFLNTSIAKGLDDYNEFETLSLLIQLFLFKIEKHTDHKVGQKKRGRKPGTLNKVKPDSEGE